jgi:hypothetical protein
MEALSLPFRTSQHSSEEVMDKVALKHVILPIHRLSSIGIIPPLFHTHISLINQRRYISLATDIVVKQGILT